VKIGLIDRRKVAHHRWRRAALDHSRHCGSGHAAGEGQIEVKEMQATERTIVPQAVVPDAVKWA